MEPTRADNYEGLIAHFYAHTYDPAGPSMPLYAGVAEEFFDDQRIGAKIALCKTEQEAFGFLGESLLEGYAPDGVYNLDTAEKIEVQVSTPIVTCAAQQGGGMNPIAE